MPKYTEIQEKLRNKSGPEAPLLWLVYSFALLIRNSGRSMPGLARRSWGNYRQQRTEHKCRFYRRRRVYGKSDNSKPDRRGCHISGTCSACSNPVPTDRLHRSSGSCASRSIRNLSVPARRYTNAFPVPRNDVRQHRNYMAPAHGNCR